MGERELIYRVTKSDLDITHIKGSGKGGQHRNKRETGVRIKHRESGAVGQATDSKSQAQNRKAAFRRMYESRQFQQWHRIKCGQAYAAPVYWPKRRVQAPLRESDLLIEYGPPGSFD